MRINSSPSFRLISTIILGAALLSACGGGTATPTAAIPPTAEAPTAAPATPTSEPLAARVNGEGILLEDFTIETKLLQASQQKLGQSSTPEELKKMSMDDLVSNTLLAQEAEKAGHILDAAALQAKADSLASQIGGAEKLAAWKQTMGYSDAAFLRALARNSQAAWERDQIMAAVPTATEQVHVQQILVQDEAYANQILDNLKNGQDFSTLALQNDPTSGGELGWFPRGFLFHQEVEDAAFSTEVGKFSGVIHSSVGYHILFVLEKDPNRVLGPETRGALQKAALAAWVKEKLSQSKIEILVS
jgi:peptidyl-prolyl cis-trans isomerase C